MGRTGCCIAALIVAASGPVAAQSRMAYVADPPAYAKYMSARCSALNEALRTSGVRGLHHDTVFKMRKDYQAACAEDEREASAKLSEEMRDKSRQKNEAKKEARTTEARLVERTALQQEQCVESRRILKTKRARTDLTEGEKTDLDRFEANYKARCG